MTLILRSCVAGEQSQPTTVLYPSSVAALPVTMSLEETIADTDTSTEAAVDTAYGRSIVFLGRGRSPPYVTESTRLPNHLSPGQASHLPFSPVDLSHAT